MTRDKGCLFSLKKTGELTAVCYSPKGVRRYSQFPLTGAQRKGRRQGTQVATNGLLMGHKEKPLP